MMRKMLRVWGLSSGTQCWNCEGRKERSEVFIIRGKTRVTENTYSGCRYNERLNAKTEGSKLLVYTGLHG